MMCGLRFCYSLFSVKIKITILNLFSLPEINRKRMMKIGIMEIYCFVQDSVGIDKIERLVTTYITECLSKPT